MSKTLRSGRMTIAHRATHGGCEILLDGRIDDSCRLMDLAEALQRSLHHQVTIDLGGVSFINSAGLREWVRTLRALAACNVAVTLRACSEEMVRKMNRVPEAHEGVRLESFHAPYRCDRCGNESIHCVLVRDHAEVLRRLEAVPVRCPQCRASMQLNELAARYLSFVIDHLGEPCA